MGEISSGESDGEVESSGRAAGWAVSHNGCPVCTISSTSADMREKWSAEHWRRVRLCRRRHTRFEKLFEAWRGGFSSCARGVEPSPDTLGR